MSPGILALAQSHSPLILSSTVSLNMVQEETLTLGLFFRTFVD